MDPAPQDLRLFQGMVALPLAAAAALLDMEDAARAPRVAGDVGAAHPGASAGAPEGGPTTDLAECHATVVAALRALATGQVPPDADPGTVGAVCAACTPEERAAGMSVVLARIAAEPADALSGAPALTRRGGGGGGGALL